MDRSDPTREAAAERGLAKAMWRLVPFLGALYFISFLDRVNISFAALTMNRDLSLTPAQFGIGAGIFFIGYVLCEIPSNLMLERFGARQWIARIMVTWGVLSIGMAFVTGPISFWAVRLVFGAAEAGFFPGIILYLTYWFPAEKRGRILGGFLLALPLSSVVGAPVSTALLDTQLFGLHGWQSMFILEGLPAIFAGFLVLRYLPDRPRDARWLTREEADAIETRLAAQRSTASHASLRDGLLNPRVWQFGLIYCGIVIGVYGFGFWAPQIIKNLGDLTNGQVGWLTTIPYLAAVCAMLVWARRSDLSGRPRRYLAAAALVGTTGFMASALMADPTIQFAALSLAAMGTYATLPVFWTLPTRLLTGSAAAGGFALINSLGNIGGYVGPTLIGTMKESYGFAGGLGILALAQLMAVSLIMKLPRDSGWRQP